MYPFLYHHFLSRIEAERAHHLALASLRLVERLPFLRDSLRRLWTPVGEGLEVTALGLRFATPLGLAGGFDKDGGSVGALALMGFSSVEVGTVVPLPQTGNPQPRIFRLPADDALINRMGFPSKGMHAVATTLARLKQAGRQALPIIGISLGKNKATPLAEAAQDYVTVLHELFTVAEFFTVNISSPNTPELRQLQTRAYLSEMLAALTSANRAAALAQGLHPPPLLVKIAPDLTFDDLDQIAELALQYGVDGLVATNTTLDRTGLSSPAQAEIGGLSGAPLRARSNAMIKHLYQMTRGKLTIIGVGGIFTGDDLWAKLAAGASYAQAYTGLIYRGPLFVRHCLTALQRRMQAEGIPQVSAITGINA